MYFPNKALHLHCATVATLVPEVHTMSSSQTSYPTRPIPVMAEPLARSSWGAVCCWRDMRVSISCQGCMPNPDSEMQDGLHNASQHELSALFKAKEDFQALPAFSLRIAPLLMVESLKPAADWTLKVTPAERAHHKNQQSDPVWKCAFNLGNISWIEPDCWWVTLPCLTGRS